MEEDDAIFSLVSGFMCWQPKNDYELTERGVNHLWSSTQSIFTPSSIQTQLTLGLSSMLVAPPRSHFCYLSKAHLLILYGQRTK